MIGKIFVHKFNPAFTCIVTDETTKGYKVKQTTTKGTKTKTITSYYERIWFDPIKGDWKEVKPV